MPLESLIFEQMNRSPQAIPFIIKNPNTEVYEFSAEAEAFLIDLKQPLSIVTVAGMYRTGKSYLLNRILLKTSKGFGVGPTVNPCTKGLWIWNEAIAVPENKHMLVVDTEGLGALDEQSNHDMKIFCLAVLLSSTFIYNSVGSIDETALQTLSLVLNLVNNLDKEHYSNRPSFVWVVRDFSLQLINDKGQSLTAKQYLQMALSCQHTKQPQKIASRKTITNAFSERDCFTLVKPIIDQQRLQKLDKIPEDELRAQFVTQTMHLRKKILQNLSQIKLNNSPPLSGREYVLMVKKYLAAINAGQVPNIVDTWTFIKQERSRQVLDHLKETYTQRIKARLANKLPMQMAKIAEIIYSFRNDIIEQYSKLAYDDDPKDVLEFVKSVQTELTRLNQRESRTYVVEAMKKEYEPFFKKLMSSYYAEYDKFDADLRTNYKQIVIEKHEERIDGITEIVQTFIDKKVAEGYRYFDRRNKDQLARVAELKEQVGCSLKAELDKVKQISAGQRKRLQEDIYSLQKTVVLLTNERNQLSEQNIKSKLEDQHNSDKYRQRNEESNATIEHLNEELAKVQSVSYGLEKQIYLDRKDIEKERALFKQREQYLTEKCSEFERKCSNLQGEFEKGLTKFQAEKKQITTHFESKIKQLTKVNKDRSDIVHELEGKIENERHLLQKKQSEFHSLKLKHEAQIQSYRFQLSSTNKKNQRNTEIEQLKKQLLDLQEQYTKGVQDAKENETKCKHYAEQLKSCRINAQNMQAIQVQKIEFQSMEIADLKHRNAELNKSYQKCLEEFQSSNKNEEESYNKKMVELVDEHQRAIRFVEQECEQKIKEMKRQVTSINKTKEQTLLQINLQRKKHEAKAKEAKDAYHALEVMYQTLNAKLNSSERDFQDMNKEKEQYYMQRMKQLEAEVEATKEKAAKYIEQNQQKSEQALNVLKNYSQMQRSQWQKRLEDEKEKCLRKLKSQKEQFEQKMHQEKQASEQMVSQLQDKIQEIEQIFNQTLHNVKYDAEIKLQKVTNQAMDERMDLNKRNALLVQEMELTKINYENQAEERKRNYEKNIQSIKKQLQADFEQHAKKMKEEYDFLESKFQQLKKSSRKIEESNLILKSQMDKEKALFREKENNYSRKINDIEKRLSEELLMSTRTIEQINNSNSKERQYLNNEIQQLRKMSLEAEESKNKAIAEYEQKMTLLQSKYKFLQSKCEKSKVDYDDVIKKMIVTVELLNRERSNVINVNNSYEECKKKLKDDYENQLLQKEEKVNKEMKDYNDKVCRLQMDNKQLRDKIMLYELKVSNDQSHRDIQNSEQVEKIRQQYDKKLQEYKIALERERQENRRLKEDKQAMDLSIRMQRSRMTNKSDIGSFVSDFQAEHDNNNGMSRPLVEDRNTLNRKYPGNTLKKQDKGGRYKNIEDFDGIMRYQ